MDQRKIGAIFGYVQIILQAVIGIIYVPLLLERIGREEYGLYQIVASIISYLTILETTLSATVLRHYTVYLIQDEKAKIENLLYVSRKLFRSISIVIIIAAFPLGIGIYYFYADSFSAGELNEILIMYLTLIVNLLISVNNYIYLACIAAHQKYVFLKLISIITLVLQPISVFFLINKYPYAAMVVVVQVAMNIATSLLRYYYCKTKLDIVIKKHDSIDSGLIRELWEFSIGILLTTVADQIFWKTDQIILGKMKGALAVTIYAVGAQLFNLYMSLASGIGSVLLPTAINKVENNGIGEADAFFRKVGRIQALLMMLVISGFVVIGKEFISVWVGTEYLESYWIALLLMLPYTIDIIQGSGLSILQALNKYTFRAKCMFVIALLNIGLTVILTYKMGIVGAAFSTAVSIVIGPGFIMNWYYKSKIHMDIATFWKEVLPVVFLGIAFVVFGRLVYLIPMKSGWLSVIVRICIFSISYFVIAYVFVMNRFEKQQIWLLSQKILRKKTTKH